MSNVLLPGSTIGMLGSGQLGRMFAFEAKRMGYNVVIYSPDKESPAGQVSDLEITAAYDDEAALAHFAQQVDAVTLEFENVPAPTLEKLAAWVPTYPQPAVLYTTQNRIREKSFLSQHGFPVTPFQIVHTFEDLEKGVQTLGLPAVLKTAGFGYDGKGQVRIDQPSQVAQAWQAIETQEAVLEGFIDFALEFSVVAARNANGNFAHYGVIENRHRHHILDTSIAPGRIEPAIVHQAVEMTQALMDILNMVGVLCVEFFLTQDDCIVINELAPRPHNSGHITLDAAITSQFEQQVRAVCGLPLGETAWLSHGVMLNLLGDLWQAGTPDWLAVCQRPEVKLHLYGKSAARPGRKMGHLNILASDVQIGLQIAEDVRGILTANRVGSTQ